MIGFVTEGRKHGIQQNRLGENMKTTRITQKRAQNMITIKNK